jgi:predicted alpha/beta-hydrolase family hydrolase
VNAGVAERLTLEIDETTRVSALLQLPPAATACFVLAHGAGAGMEHPSMSSVATELATRNIATLRFQFPYMERGSRRPDPPPLATPPCAQPSQRPRAGRPNYR